MDIKPPMIQAVVHEKRDFAGYTRETVRFESRPGMEVYAYLLLPKERAERLPAAVCLPGHGRGVDSICGIGPKGEQRQPGRPDEYQMDFALTCVEHGWAAFAVEQVSFGYRRDEKARKQGAGASSCVRDSMAALMLGETMTGWRVWDAMRSVDYLFTRREIDPRKILTMGISGGGLTSLFTAALDTRIRGAMVSGYFNTWRDSVLGVDHCVDNFVPGLMHICEMPDLAGLIAPRLLFCEGGASDPIFPGGAFLQAVNRAEQIYTAFGARRNFGWEQFAGEHVFNGNRAFPFLIERLREN
jgi:dienelactone hydrolase